MLRTLNITLSNPVKPGITPVTLEALITDEPFGLVIGSGIAEQLELEHVGLRQVTEPGKNIRLQPYAGPIRVSTALNDAYTGAVICARGAIIGGHLLSELGIDAHSSKGVATENPYTTTPALQPSVRKEASNILVREDAIDAETCRMLCQHAALHPRYRAGLLNTKINTSEKTDGYVDTTVRDTFIVPVDEIKSDLIRIIHGLITQHIEPFFSAKIEWWESPQFLSYKAGGQYKPHVDGERWVVTPGGQGRWERYLDRDYSFLLYPNDDYTGGELVFPDLNITIQPKAGMLVSFPSSSKYLHGALPTGHGERLVLVSWLTAFGTLRVRERTNATILMKDAVMALAQGT